MNYELSDVHYRAQNWIWTRLGPFTPRGVPLPVVFLCGESWRVGGPAPKFGRPWKGLRGELFYFHVSSIPEWSAFELFYLIVLFVVSRGEGFRGIRGNNGG